MELKFLHVPLKKIANLFNMKEFVDNELKIPWVIGFLLESIMEKVEMLVTGIFFFSYNVIKSLLSQCF